MARPPGPKMKICGGGGRLGVVSMKYCDCRGDCSLGHVYDPDNVDPLDAEMTVIRIVVQKREDAWLKICELYDKHISKDVVQIIKENSSSPIVRLLDVRHRLHHCDPTLTWGDIRVKLVTNGIDI